MKCLNKYLLLSSLCSLVSYRMNAQFTVYNNGLAAVSIVSSCSVSITGGYTSQTLTGVNGKMDNQGTLQLTGDWNNQNTAATPNPFSTNAGTVIFNGSVLQNILGTNTTTFYNLTIANSGAGVSLSENTTTTNTLTLTSGIITTGANLFILSNTSAASLIYTNGFVYGTFRRYVASNTNSYLFPLGDGNSSTNRHQISFLNNSITGVNYLDASVTSFVQSAPNNDAALNTSQGGTPITATAGEATGQTVIWTLTPDAVPSGGNYGVQLFVENTNLSSADDNLFCPLKRTLPSITYADFATYDGSTSLTALGTAGRIYNSGNGYAQRTGYTTFSQHTIGKGSVPLPVELIGFDAKLDGNIVNEEWSTASESNSDYFMVQQSKDAVDFTDLVQINAAGNSSTIKNYSAVDYEPYSDVSYYRLKQVDYNGNFKYSNISEVYFKNADVLSVYPNPTSGPFYVCISGMNGQEVFILVRDVIGQEYYSKVFFVANDKEIFAIDPSGKLSPGIYFVVAASNNTMYEKKIMIK